LPIFVAIPKLSEAAKRIAHGYNLLVIESIPQNKEQLAMLQDEIQKRLSERIVEEGGIEHPRSPDLKIIHRAIRGQ